MGPYNLLLVYLIRPHNSSYIPRRSFLPFYSFLSTLCQDKLVSLMSSSTSSSPSQWPDNIMAMTFCLSTICIGFFLFSAAWPSQKPRNKLRSCAVSAKSLFVISPGCCWEQHSHLLQILVDFFTQREKEILLFLLPVCITVLQTQLHTMMTDHLQ